MKLRNFKYFVINSTNKDSNEKELLPVYYHVEKSHLPWLIENHDNIIVELTQILQDNIDEITGKFSELTTENTDQSIKIPSGYILISGINLISIVFNTEKRNNYPTIISCDNNKYERIKLTSFNVLLWIYPINKIDSIPLGFL